MDSIIEEPILLTMNNDFLGTLKKAEAITNFIEHNEKLLSSNNMIALYGEWGSGKSSILKTIEDKLNKEKYETIWIDMWKEESDYTNLNIKILNKILLSLNIKSKQRKELLKSFLILGKGIKINVGPISYDMRTNFEQLNKELENSQKTENFVLNFQERVDKYYQDTGKQIIVFLDDIDRCSNDNMLNIIWNIKLLLSVKNIVFIFGIDRDAVTLALKNKYNNEANKAYSFLEKIFPISFNVPHEFINKKNFDILIKNSFTNLEKGSYENIQKFFDKMKIINPRRIIKILNKYKILEEELETKQLLNSKNEWNIMLVLFLIMEHEFNIENYVEMLKNNKKQLLSNLIKLDLSQASSSVPKRKNIQYEEYPIYLRTIELENGKAQEVYVSIELYEYFSNPKDLIRKEIPVIDTDEILDVKIKFETWIESFGDSINKRFCYILQKHRKEIICCFWEYIDGKKYDDFDKKLKELVYNIDLLL